MPIVERHTTPDGSLTLVVDCDATGDWTVGFTQGSWHIHGDMLASMYGGTPESAVRTFVDRIICSRETILVYRIEGQTTDVVIAEPHGGNEPTFAQPHESIVKRVWSGTETELRTGTWH